MADSQTFEEYKKEEEKITPKKTTTETKKKKGKAKIASLISQIVAAIWVAAWCSLKFYKAGANVQVADIILSGLAIAACFSPVYFSLMLDKIKNIRFGDTEEKREEQ